MICVTYGPLEGESVFLCRAFPSEIVEPQGYLDLHWGMNPIGWKMCPLSLDTLDKEWYLWRHLDTMSSSHSIPLHLNVGLWKPKTSSPRPYKSNGLRVFDGALMVDDDVTWIDGERDTFLSL
jgi:hypothetical protein